MSPLDNLPPDQRAVLQMVLQRGRSYDEIARALSIDRGAVRQRALDGFDAITPTTVLPGPERALVTDYLLGQLPDRVAEQVYSYLQASESDREWAEAVAAEVAPITTHSLPEIPVGAPLGADAWRAGEHEHHSDSQPVATAPAAGRADELEALEEHELEDTVEQAPADMWPRSERSERSERAQRAQRPERAAVPRQRSSRRGGAILLSLVAALIAAAIIVAVVTSGGSRHRTTGSRSRARVTSTSATTTSTPQILAQLNLSSPTGTSATVGVAQVIREAGVVGIVIDAQGMPANTSHNAYAVWLYSSASRFRFVGFVPNLVGKNGKLATEGKLPPGAASYRRILITLETQSHPARPGEVVLSGPFREHP